MRSRILATLAILGLLLFTALATASSCDETDNAERMSDKDRQTSINLRAEQFRSAEQAIPIRPNVNFPRRAALEEYNHRTDRVGTPYYVYILGDNGNIIGYYVATTDPINACDFLASTEDVETQYEGTIVLTAPSLDGIYYGGAGASSGCDEWIFFDASTNAMIKIRGVKFFVADEPLALEADPILVAPVAAP